MVKIRKFLQYEPMKQILLLQALFIHIGVKVALDLFPLFMLLKLLNRIEISMKEETLLNCSDTLSRLLGWGAGPEVLAWAVRTTSPFVPGSRCLCQAIAAKFILAIHGYFSKLRIGVIKTDSDELSAHAWLVRKEQILIGNITTISSYTTLPSLSRAII